MKRILTKEEVAKAMQDMAAQGKKVTLNSLYAALGNRGSMSTLSRLKAEIQGEAAPTGDSPTGLKVFRELWGLALAEGRQHQEELVKQLREELQTLAMENERLDGLAVAAENRTQESERARLTAETELSHTKEMLATEQTRMQADLVKATEQAKQVLEKLAEERAAHAKEMTALRQELANEVRKIHELELELVRVKALYEAQSAGGNEPTSQTSKRSRRGTGD